MKVKMISESRRRKEAQARTDAARQELMLLRSSLTEAYRVFNSTADPALLEASILEIGALQMRCDRLLRSIKEMNGEYQNDPGYRRTSGHRGRARLAAAQAPEKADQMGV